VEPNENDRMWAAAAHASAIVGFAIWGPLIVYLVQKDKSPFVAYHALQALIFQIACFVIIMTIGMLTCGIGVLLLFPFFAVEGWYAYRAYTGDWAGYPMLENIGKPGT
jgi:hypothetical protein